MEPRDLSGLTEYVPGRGVEDVARERGLDPDTLVTLSSNENPLGPAPAAIEAVRNHAEGIHRYPKASHVDLVDALAERWAVGPEQVWLANGGDGALDYLSRAMLEPTDTVLVPAPGFAYYGMSARFHHADVTRYELSAADDFSLDADVALRRYRGERIVYVTSPHNPTGSAMSIADVRELAEETDADTLVVVDEAYGAFSRVDSAITLVRERDDVAVLRSFSKSYGLAGLRLGYAVVPDGWADAYAHVNTPFAANELGCRAGLAALGDTEHLEGSVTLVREGRRQLRRELTAPTWPSEGNFVLTDVGKAAPVTEAMMERGVIVRDCTSFGLPNCIRITVPTEADLRRAIRACNEAFAEVDGGSTG